MNPDFFSSILWDGLMAAIAATGFAVISNPPKRRSPSPPCLRPSATPSAST